MAPLFFFFWGTTWSCPFRPQHRAIEKCTTDDTLQTVDAFILKVIQLYEGSPFFSFACLRVRPALV